MKIGELFKLQTFGHLEKRGYWPGYFRILYCMILINKKNTLTIYICNLPTEIKIASTDPLPCIKDRAARQGPIFYPIFF